MYICSAPDARARLGALKLLGLALAGGGSEAVWGARPEEMMGQVVRHYICVDKCMHKSM